MLRRALCNLALHITLHFMRPSDPTIVVVPDDIFPSVCKRKILMKNTVDIYAPSILVARCTSKLNSVSNGLVDG